MTRAFFFPFPQNKKCIRFLFLCVKHICIPDFSPLIYKYMNVRDIQMPFYVKRDIRNYLDRLVCLEPIKCLWDQKEQTQ